MIIAIIGECYSPTGDYVGSKGAGKDAVATMLGAQSYHLELPPERTPIRVRLALADAVKRIAMSTYGLTYEQCYGPQELKERVDPRWDVSPRLILQRIGTELGRNIHLSTWTRLLLRTTEENTRGYFWNYGETGWNQLYTEAPVSFWVVPDVRFANELTDLRAGHPDVRVLRVIRPDVDRPLDPHPSEAKIEIPPGIPVWDIHNGGTLADLHAQVQQIPLDEI